MTSGIEREAQVEARVREHLQPGEIFRAAIWVSRADSRPPAGMTRAEMSPFRFRFRWPGPGARKGVFGSPRSLAVTLAEHVRIVTDPRVLALTDRRLIVLAERLGAWGRLLRPAAAGLPPLSLRWICARAQVATAGEKGGRLRLTFTDGSSITLLTPSVGARAFLAAGRWQDDLS